MTVTFNDRRRVRPVACLAILLRCSGALAACLMGNAAVAQEAAASPQQAPDTFMIAAFDVSGVTKLSAAEVERLVYPFEGPGKSNADVVAARKALQDAYAARGYEAVLVDVPVQPVETFRQGIVQIAVSETPIGRVQVVDAKHHSAAVVRSQVPSLVVGQPVDLKALQRDVAAANRFPDRTIDPVFHTGAAPGTIDIDLKVTDDSPYHASFELNNDNSPNTDPLRVSGTVRYANLFGQGHILSVTGSLAPQNIHQSGVVSASYTAPLIGTPWSFVLYGYKSNSNVAALGGTNVLGNGYQIGARATYRLPSEKSFQQISFGTDFKDFKESLFLQEIAVQPTRIRYVPLVAEYALTGADDRQSYGVTLGVTGGLRVVKRTACFDQQISGTIPTGVPTCALPGGVTGIPADQFTGRGIDAAENFVHLNLELNYTHVLPRDLVAAFHFAGQLSDSPLVTNEQFSVGGVTSVRGYYVSEAVGDDGFVEGFELRSPDFSGVAKAPIDEARLFAFGDVGYARVRRVTAGQQESFRLASVGVGARTRLFKYFETEALVGVPLRDGPVTRTGDARYSFSLKGEF